VVRLFLVGERLGDVVVLPLEKFDSPSRCNSCSISLVDRSRCCWRLLGYSFFRWVRSVLFLCWGNEGMSAITKYPS
jgi:hypothetical protein